MSFLSWISGDIISSVGDAIDNIFTSDEERQELENEIKRDEFFYKLEHSKLQSHERINETENITQRWLSDNQSLITKMVRPFIVVWVVMVFTLIAFLDGNYGDFTLKESYIPVFEMLLIGVIGAYFGGRSFEKISSIKKTSNGKSEI